MKKIALIGIVLMILVFACVIGATLISPESDTKPEVQPVSEAIATPIPLTQDGGRIVSRKYGPEARARVAILEALDLAQDGGRAVSRKYGPEARARIAILEALGLLP